MLQKPSQTTSLIDLQDELNRDTNTSGGGASMAGDNASMYDPMGVKSDAVMI
jgi:hypothetical protein